MQISRSIQLDFTIAIGSRKILQMASPRTDRTWSPATFAAMVAAAECLAADIDYIRVDLYSTDERVIFGELTLVPAYGHAPFSPRDVDFHFGELWRIQAKETAR